MIGGPSDVVVESNIVRAVPALREPALREPVVPRAPTPAETMSRASPLPEAGSNGSWPLQPEPPAPPAPPALPRRGPRIEPLPEEQISAPPPHPEPPPRPQREVLSALADDLAAHAPPMAPVAPVTPLPPRNRPPAPPRLTPAEARTEHRPEPRPPAAQPAVEPAAVDQSLAEMAQRLEAALRKPKAVDTRAPVAPSPEHQEEEEEVASSAPPPLPPRPARPAEAKPARAEGNKAKEGVREGKALYDTLEQEMASLLGRPASKN
jgi:flagellar protein FliO/FliZ